MPATLVVESGGGKFARAVLIHEVEARTVFSQPQLQDLGRIGEGVADDRAGLGDAKRDDGRVGTELSHQVELLLRLLEADLTENFLGGGGVGASVR